MDKLPSIPHEERVITDKMKDLLKQHNLWKEGMTYDEASDAISKLPKDKYMNPGLQLVKIQNISVGTGQDGKAIVDKEGFPCLQIKFRNKAEEIMIDNFFYNPNPSDGRKSKSQWRLAALKVALGVKEEEEQSLATLSKIAVYTFVKKVLFVDEAGQPVLDSEGKQRFTTQPLGKYFKYEKGGKVPSVKEEELTDTRVYKKKAPVAQEPSKQADGFDDVPATTPPPAAQVSSPKPEEEKWD